MVVLMRNCLSEPVAALANDPDGPPVRVNVLLRMAPDPAAQREAISRIEALSGAAVHFRPALGIATAVVPRNRLRELNDIEAVERVDIDVKASYSELID
jgi:hypothetical protein